MGEKVAAKILVFGEAPTGSFTTSTKEVLGIGRKLADALAGDVVGIMIGDKVQDSAREALSFGVDKVLVIENPELREYHPDLYLAVMEDICREIDPDILLMGQTFLGADLAPRLAFRLGGGLTTDCVDLAIDKETNRLLCTKPIYGGNVLAVYCSEGRPQMAAIREKVFPLPVADKGRKGEVIVLDREIDLSGKKLEYVERIEEETSGVKLEEAEVIVCGGRGMGSSEAFGQLEELAKIMKGAIVGTRPTCEKGWINSRLQVGLTGKKVAPKLYIAVGVSGAIQHMAGVGSKCIVAINKDPEANIFNEAHYGAVGDYKEILPSFKEKLKELLENKQAPT